MIDTHCHLTDPVFKSNLDMTVAKASDVGVHAFIVPSVDIATSQQAVDMAGTYAAVHAAVGIHPMWADVADTEEIDRMTRQVADLVATRRRDIVAIGEIGLDDNPGDAGSSGLNMATRRHAFVTQMALARDLDLPVIIHSRGQIAELVEILEFFGLNSAGGVLHAFSGSTETAVHLRRLGYLRGVAGTITRPGAARLRRIIANTTPEDIVLETDAPWIGNTIHESGLVEPADLALTAAAAAGLMRLPVETLIATTDANAMKLFRLAGVIP